MCSVCLVVCVSVWTPLLGYARLFGCDCDNDDDDDDDDDNDDGPG